MVVKPPTTLASTTTTIGDSLPVHPLVHKPTSPLNPTETQIFRKAVSQPTSSRWKAQPFHQPMAFGNPQLLASQYSAARFSNSIYNTTTSHINSATHHTTRPRTKTINSTSYPGSPFSTGHSGSKGLFPRFLQLDLCNPQEKQRNETGIQSESSQSICQGTTFQNGNSLGSSSSYSTKRLSDFNRSPFGIHSHSDSSTIQALSTVPLGREVLGIHNSTIRAQYCPLPVHKTHSSNSSMGTRSGSSSKCISRRSNLYLTQSSPGSKGHSTTAEQAAITGISTEYDDHAGQDSQKQTTGSEEITESSTQQSCTNTTVDPQSNDENSSCNICSSPSPVVHTASITPQEPVSTVTPRLGHATTTTSRVSTRNSNMAETSPRMEREIHSPSNSEGDNLRRRERHRMGLQLEQPDHPWLLDSTRGTAINQLEGIESGISGDRNVQNSTHQFADSNGQHHIDQLHQQTRRNSIIIVDDVSDRCLEVLFETPHPPNSVTHQRDRQRGSRSRISSTSVQEPVEGSSRSVPTTSSSTRKSRRRSFCGQDDRTSTKIRVMETRSGRIYSRRFHHPVEHLPSTLDQPSVESTHQVSTENSPRTSTTGNTCSTPLAISHLLSSTPTASSTAADISSPSSHRDNTQVDSSSITTEELEALRMEYLNKKFGTSSQLTLASKEFLSSTLTSDTTTNKAYIKAQREFVKWSLSSRVDINNYNAFDLVNFLQHVHSVRDRTGGQGR